jgi:hypothetical protein
VSHPDDVRFCKPCGWLFSDARELRHHRVRVHGVEPPCHRQPVWRWCDYDRTTEIVHHGGFMGHTCVQ